MPTANPEYLIQNILIILFVTAISAITLLSFSILIALNRDEALFLRQFLIKHLKKRICRA